MMRSLWLVLWVISLAGSADAQTKQTYLCVETNSVGFIQNSKKQTWGVSKFNPKRFSMIFDGQTALVKVSGNSREDNYSCLSSSGFEKTLYHCTDDFQVLVFDAARLRFTHAFLFGYVGDSSDTLAIEYGDCQRF